MCTGGRIKHHLQNNLDRPESTILFVGYQAVGTLGRQILEGAHRVRLFGEYFPVLARISKVNGMSAHADQNELIDWIKGYNPTPEAVYTIHGEPDAAQTLADRIGREMHVAARPGKPHEVVDLS
jgi:metallo-beta-lactamase family protein